MLHESYIQAVRDIAIDYLAGHDYRSAQRVRRAKLTYGHGLTVGLRGVTIYGQWANGHGPDSPEPMIEICAGGEESIVQVAGTTIHELGHVLAGHGAGHSKDWKQACVALGLRCCKAAGTRYSWSMFAPEIRDSLVALGLPTDGQPLGASKFWPVDPKRVGGIGTSPATGGGCTAGVGTRGGKSRGKGSGSRMIKHSCAQCDAIWRMTRKYSPRYCPCCGSEDITRD